jgi:succinate dehydrogenase/fumarate reductase flavoprotein subunit
VWFSPTDVERAKTHLRSLAGDYVIPESIVEAWASETSQNTEWLRERAAEADGRIEWDPTDPQQGRPGITSITHGDEMARFGWIGAPTDEFPELDGNDCGTEWNYFGPSEGYSRLWLTLKACIELRGIDVIFDARATALVQNEGGEVIGVVVTRGDGTQTTIGARHGVVLACGGFANNQEMVRNYLRLPYATPWGSPANTGDGIRMAQRLGADLAHPYNYMAQPGLRMPPYENGEWAMPAAGRFIYVGADGRRFIDETVYPRHGKIRVRGTFDFFPGVPMWTIFDEDTRLAGPVVPPRETYAGGWMKQVERYEWSADNSTEIERGWIARGDTVRELAETLGIDADGLEAQISEYNEGCARAHDVVFGRVPESMTPIQRAPFYGYRWAQLMISTLGGIRKDGRARALDTDGNPIPRLYCAGDVASSYSWALGGGYGLADAMAFGRLAARHALQEVPLPQEALALVSPD